MPCAAEASIRPRSTSSWNCLSNEAVRSVVEAGAGARAISKPVVADKISAGTLSELPLPAGDLVRRYRRKLQPNNLARIAHRNPLRWHRSSFGVAKGAT